MVGEVPLTAGELRRATVRLRADVVAELPRAGAGARARADYWTTPIEGRTPHAALVERSLRAAVGDAVLRQWACQAGLLADPTEAGFRTRLDAENARRATAAAAGRPLPGVPRYDEESFARTEAAQLSTALRDTLADRVDLSDARLRARYAELITAADPAAGVPLFDQSRDRVRLDLLTTAFNQELSHRVGTIQATPLPTADLVVREAE
ncbi:hypothetical protein [Embleya sp. AB8]|uniref:hypothetical protein n=1 Tax=Embleya sp. AB8 TaxID=3156304 RepID=UPI003C71B104